MTKKSHKRSPRWRKENAGCMWGLISMFDFRHGRSTQRLLSDKRCGSSRNSGIGCSKNKVDQLCTEEKHGDIDSLANFPDEADEVDRVVSGVVSFKTHVEKEISRAHHSGKKSDSKIEWIIAELGIGANAEQNHRDATKNGVLRSGNNLNASPSLKSQQYDYPSTSEVLSSDLDLGSVMLDYCCSGIQCEDNQLECLNKSGQYPFREGIGDLEKSEHVDEPVNNLQKAIVDLTDAFLRQNSINSSKLVGNTKVHQPKDMFDALKVLNSNKELFLKLLKDPESPILKHIQNLQNAHFCKSSKLDQNQLLEELPVPKQLQKETGHNFFNRRAKLTVENQSKQRDHAKVLNRIVVLKPISVGNQNHSNTICPKSSGQSHNDIGNKDDGERMSSHFSLKEIKRKLTNAIIANRKGRHPIAMDGVLHKIPYGKQITGEGETSCGREVFGSGGEKELNTKEMQKSTELAIASKIVGKYENSIRNSAPGVLYREAAFYDQGRKRLAELLRTGSESEPLPSIQLSKSLGSILSFPGVNISPRLSLEREKEPEVLQEKTHLLPRHSTRESNAEHLDFLIHKESFLDAVESEDAKNVIMEIVEDRECIQNEGFSSQLEAQSVSISYEDDLSNGAFKEEGYSLLLEPGQSEGRLQASTPSTPIAVSSAVTQEPKDAEFAINHADRPSPISVLEPLFFEDINSPSSFVIEHATNVMTQTQSREPPINDSAAASGSTDSEADSTMCMEFDEALLFDELEISCSLLIDDPKLLFDSIDEVLTEIKERHFSCTPWVSFINPNIRPHHKQEDFLKEACKRINWHLDVQFPSTLEQVIKKDLDGTIWIDIQLGAEHAVGKIGDTILDYLIEEAALVLCNWYSKSSQDLESS